MATKMIRKEDGKPKFFYSPKELTSSPQMKYHTKRIAAGAGLAAAGVSIAPHLHHHAKHFTYGASAAGFGYAVYHSRKRDQAFNRTPKGQRGLQAHQQRKAAKL